MTKSILEFKKVGKSFNGHPALKDVSFTVPQGACVALVGENGAGKSTLMKILSGVWPFGSFSGEVFFEGTPLQIESAVEGRKRGISIIHQELCLFPKLTVAENMLLTEESPYNGCASQKLLARVSWKNLFATAQKTLDDLGFPVSADSLIEDLSVAKRQLVEIAKCFHQGARILILDEPTSALAEGEVKLLFNVIQRLKGKMTFIYISHKLDEVFALSDEVVVLRDGQAVAQFPTSQTDEATLIQHMVGRKVSLAPKDPIVQGVESLLSVENLSHTVDGRKILSGITFQVGKGEVVGLAGLMGSGRSELLRSLMGVLPGERKGEIFVSGNKIAAKDFECSSDAGLAFVPEDRKKDGLFLDQSIQFNLTVMILKEFLRQTQTLNLQREEAESEKLAKKFRVKYSDLSVPVRTLSGGNQQKVLIAKVVATKPKVLFLDEPTRGVDIGAKEEVYQIIRDLAKEGMGILVASSELPELLTLCDKIVVLCEGRMTATIPNQKLTQERIMTFAALGRSIENGAGHQS